MNPPRNSPKQHGRPQGRGGKPTWTKAEVAAWFAGRLPDDWFTGAPDVQVDADEIVVVGPLPTPTLADDASDDERAVAAAVRVNAFREDTRTQRMRIADDAEALWGRKISWGASVGDTRALFTTQAVPVMTRLRFDERKVLDTLIDGGVARSRSEALAWCVRLVSEHEADWIQQLRDALTNVTEVRDAGPGPTAT